MVKALMIQGTSSNAGKSLFVTALCRIYMKRGYKVAPFKSQNMSLNSYTTSENGEMAIAQYLQSIAAKVEPEVDMNPILLKPKGNFTSQVIIQGKVIGDMNFYDYQHQFKEEAVKAYHESYKRLASKNDIIFIEGAGSPAEINMRNEDIANMDVAHMANANVILVADIDRGGVFASIAGTFALLDDRDLSRLKAVIINKFSGNLDILKPGIDKIEKIINAPVLGVVPYDKSLKLPEEDSQSLQDHDYFKEEGEKDIVIGVIKLPKIANFTDIDPFEVEEDTSLRMISVYDSPDVLDNVDAIIIPGTRTSTEDAKALYDNGLYDKIIELAEKIPVIGICGGYQILGQELIDESMQESHLKHVKGLGLLDIKTEFKNQKKAACQTKAIIPSNDKLLDNIDKNNQILDAFKISDDVLRLGVQSIADLVTNVGLINLDFADIKAIMTDSGVAHLGVSRASGENKAEEAAKKAISSPLLETSIKGAGGVLVNVVGGKDLGILEINNAVEMIHHEVDEDAQIIFGAVIDENLKDEIIITVIATKFNNSLSSNVSFPSNSTSTFTGFDNSNVSDNYDNGFNSQMNKLEIPPFLR